MRSKSGAEALQQQEQHRRKVTDARSLAEAAAVISELLRILNDRGFAGVLEIEYTKLTFFGGARTMRKGAWAIGTDQNSIPVWLISDGRIGFSRHRYTINDPYARKNVYVTSIADLDERDRANVNSLLREFKDRLEGEASGR
jgi:hypothetical protein